MRSDPKREAFAVTLNHNPGEIYRSEVVGALGMRSGRRACRPGTTADLDRAGSAHPADRRWRPHVRPAAHIKVGDAAGASSATIHENVFLPSHRGRAHIDEDAAGVRSRPVTGNPALTAGESPSQGRRASTMFPWNSSSSATAATYAEKPAGKAPGKYSTRSHVGSEYNIIAPQTYGVSKVEQILDPALRGGRKMQPSLFGGIRCIGSEYVHPWDTQSRIFPNA